MPTPIEIEQALRTLADTKDAKALDFVMRYPQTPPDVLCDLYRKWGHKDAFAPLCYNPSTPDALLREIFHEHRTEHTAFHFLQRPGLPEDLALGCVEIGIEIKYQWYNFPFPDVMYPSVEERLRDSLDDRYTYKNIEAFLQRALLLSTFTTIATHYDFKVRLLVVACPNTPSEVWMGMHKDRSKRVREAVAARANKMGLVDVFDAIG